MKEKFKQDLLQLLNRSNDTNLQSASMKALAQMLSAEALAESIKELAKAIDRRN